MSDTSPAEDSSAIAAALTPQEAGPQPTPVITEVVPAVEPEPDARTVFLAALRSRLATSNYGLSAQLGLSLTANGLLVLEAKDAQEALRAASAALATIPDGDGRTWQFVGSGPDLETGRYRAVVRVTPLL